MNAIPIHILHLEDNPLDAELVTEFLRADSVDFTIERVWTREDFTAALAGDHDLILADHRLPTFDGEAALDLARELAPDIPFIFVSGTLGEEVAVEALKRGATDYVTKQRLDRLSAVVRRALAEVAEREERRQAQAALELSEESFTAFADAAPMLCWTAKPDGDINWYNHRWYEYTGATPEQMRGWGWQSVHDPDELPRVLETWKAALGDSRPFEMIFPLRGADGVYRDFLTRAVPVRDAAGRVVRWVGTNVDISVQRATETALRESEARLLLATSAAAVGIWDFDPVSGNLRWDEACRAMFGLPPVGEVSFEDSFLAGVHPDDRAFAATASAAAMDPAGSGRYDIEYRTIGLGDGVERWIAARGRGLFEDGRCVRFAGTVVDITDRKRATAAAIESRDALRQESHALELLNRLAGRIAAELDLTRLVQEVVDAGLELAGAELAAFFYNVIGDDGDSYMLHALAGAERHAFDDLPELRITEMFAPTFSGEKIVRLDDVLADPRYGRMEPHRGMPKGHPDVRSYLAVPVILRSGEVAGGLFFGHRRTGMFDERAERLVAGLASQAALGIENARLFEASQRLNQTLEAQVAERTAERDRIWQVSDDLLGVAGRDGVWRSINPAWTSVLGWEPDEVIGRTSEWLEHPDDREAGLAAMVTLAAGRGGVELQTRLRTRDGAYRCLSWRVVPMEEALYCVARDITAQMEQGAALAEAEDRLRQARKMETLGQLTGGVAHDFNNLLQIVTGNLDLLRRHLPDDSPRLRRAADNAMAGADRAATLTQRLLAFSRRQPLAPRAVHPGRLVGGMTDLLHRTLGEPIAVSTEIAADAWMVEVDPNQLEGALLNLAVNARDAMPGGGSLTIAIANLTLDASLIAQSGEVTPGEHVAISVGDTGEGIAPDMLARVFEPFFTTKDVGKGTGLGLSMVYGFVQQSGGHVRIESEIGAGTRVTILLPRLMAAEAPAAEPLVAGEARGGDETILVCEDDDGVRAFSVESLRELGYRVMEAHDGPAALDMLHRHCEEVDLLFTDVILPGGMMGSDLAAKAAGICQDVRVLFTTGYARDAIVHDGRLDAGVDLITKPFTFRDLAVRVREALDRQGAA